MAQRARYVRIERDQIAMYAASLPGPAAEVPEDEPAAEQPEDRAAFWITLDAINFGSGWFPTLRKRPGRSGYATVAGGVRERFSAQGPWSAEQLSTMRAPAIARVVGQAPDHPLMELFARSLRDLGRHLLAEHRGSFGALAASTAGSAVALARKLGGWRCFADVARYEELELPFLKRAQIAAADLARAGVIAAHDLSGLTMFADNLVPHVLRLDGILRYDLGLVARIEGGELLQPGSMEEVEIRACAVAAVEQIVAAHPGMTAAELDGILWRRGQDRRYKRVPRHRCRCTAY